MPNRLMDSDLNSETKNSLIQFSNTLNDEATTLENMKMRLDDVNRILAILNQNNH
jgi:hypothetical protein